MKMHKLNILFTFTALLAADAHAFGKRRPVEPIATPTPVASSTPQAAATATPVNDGGSGSAPADPYYKTLTGVDMRPCDGPVESQQTPWCTAFGIKGILETMLCDHVRLSAHHAWSFYEEYSVDAAAKAVPGNKLTTWDMWPESQRNPTKGYLDAAKSMITGMDYIDADDDIAEVIKALDAGFPIYVGLAVPSDMASGYAVIRANTRITKGGHAVEIVGYGTSKDVPGGMYFIIKNSWGIENGDKGYQYMPVSVCDLRGMYCEFYRPKGAKKVVQ